MLSFSFSISQNSVFVGSTHNIQYNICNAVYQLLSINKTDI